MADSRRTTTFEDSTQSKATPLNGQGKRSPLLPIPINNFGVEIGGQSGFDVLDRRISRGVVIVKREVLRDGTERVTYRNVAP